MKTLFEDDDMPIFDFKCRTCGAEREALLPLRHPGYIECHDCGQNMEKKVSAPPRAGILFTGLKGSASMRIQHVREDS
jgi:putative FmdB family regulatory protein